MFPLLTLCCTWYTWYNNGGTTAKWHSASCLSHDKKTRRFTLQQFCLVSCDQNTPDRARAYLHPARPDGLEQPPTLVESVVGTSDLPRLKGDADKETHHRYHHLERFVAMFALYLRKMHYYFDPLTDPFWHAAY